MLGEWELGRIGRRVRGNVTRRARVHQQLHNRRPESAGPAGNDDVTVGEIKVHGRFLSRILLRFSINRNLPTLLSVATLQEEIYTVVYDIRRRPAGVGARTVRA